MLNRGQKCRFHVRNIMWVFNVLQVPPGSYRLSAIAATPDSAPELQFSPHHIDVVIHKPLLDVKFYQVCVNIYSMCGRTFILLYI